MFPTLVLNLEDMNFPEFLAQYPLILTEGSIVERLRRGDSLPLDPMLVHAGFLFSEQGRDALGALFRQYLNIGREYNLPFLIFTPTWRANPDRISQAGMDLLDINGEACRFLNTIRNEYGTYSDKIQIGGLMGCRGDAYKPEETLSTEEAFTFHQTQVNALAQGGADFLFAATLPAFPEALGLGKAMAQTGKPYILSFILDPSGTLLDGTPFNQAMELLEKELSPRPVGYMANCMHPVRLDPVLRSVMAQSPELLSRFLGLQANASTLPPGELDGLDQLSADEPQHLAANMMILHQRYGLKIMGGCCGTDDRFIHCLGWKMQQILTHTPSF